MKIVPVAPGEAAAVARFMERVIRTSVDASDAEKEGFVVHTRQNVERWAEGAIEALHLKAVDGDEQLQGVVMAKQHWNLCHLFVEPATQRQGLGRALMEAAIAACRERRTRPYILLNSARNAAGFYERMGFTRVPDAPAPYTGLQFQLDL